jgi:hypothetical protein
MLPDGHWKERWLQPYELPGCQLPVPVLLGLSWRLERGFIFVRHFWPYFNFIWIFFYALASKQLHVQQVHRRTGWTGEETKGFESKNAKIKLVVQGLTRSAHTLSSLLQPVRLYWKNFSSLIIFICLVFKTTRKAKSLKTRFIWNKKVFFKYIKKITNNIILISKK